MLAGIQQSLNSSGTGLGENLYRELLLPIGLADLTGQITAPGPEISQVLSWSVGQGSERRLEPLTRLVQLGGVRIPPGNFTYRSAPYRPGKLYPEKAELAPNFSGLRQGLSDLAKLGISEPGALLANLLMLLLREAWSLPSGVPGVPLYDYLRTAAAIAGALGEQGAQPFLLVVGDMGGIQSHIYRVQEAETGVGGIAKRLRARSLEVALAAEAWAFAILESLDLPYSQRLMSAGGKFYLLLPNNEDCRQALEASRRDWEEWSLRQGATLIPYLAYQAFDPDQFRRFDQLMDDIHRELAMAKLRPLASTVGKFKHLDELYPSSFQGRSLVPCAACGIRPAALGQGLAVCAECQRDADVGGQLPRAKNLGIVPGSGDYRFPGLNLALQPGSYTMRLSPDLAPDQTAWEFRPLLGYLPTVAAGMAALGAEARGYGEWAAQKGLADQGFDAEPRRPLGFSELAALSTGAPYLGVLRMDADRMGEVFSSGFGTGGTVASRVATLSRMVDTFFAVEVPNLLQHPGEYAARLKWPASGPASAEQRQHGFPLIYAVYAGGDDLFLIGPWNYLLLAALDIAQLWQEYTQNPGLTLSGGFVLAQPHEPVPRLAEMAGEAEERAKKANKADPARRGHLDCFGQPVAWDELGALLDWAVKLNSDVAGGRVSHQLAYSWLGLYRQYRRESDPARAMRYKPLLAYRLRKEEYARSNYQGLLDHQNSLWRHVPVWVQWGLYLGR